LRHRPASLGDERDHEALAVGVLEDLGQDVVAEPLAAVGRRHEDPVDARHAGPEALDADARDVERSETDRVVDLADLARLEPAPDDLLDGVALELADLALGLSGEGGHATAPSPVSIGRRSSLS